MGGRSGPDWSDQLNRTMLATAVSAQTGSQYQHRVNRMASPSSVEINLVASVVNSTPLDDEGGGKTIPAWGVNQASSDKAENHVT